MINRDRLLSTFLHLTTIDSESRSERALAETLRRRCEELGGEAVIDDAGERCGGDSGNLFVRVAGTSAAAEPLFFSAHMDTVKPGRGVRARVDGEFVRTDGSTILGADDKSGCAVLLELIAVLRERNIQHGDIELCFTICEEEGLLGAKYFDASRARAKRGLVLDANDPHAVFHRAPAANKLQWTVRGLEAHAAVAPERGISALRIAAEAVAQMPFGRIDHETTANVGTFEAIGATNVVSPIARIEAEARSHDLEKLQRVSDEMSRCVHHAAEIYRPADLETGAVHARVEERIERDYERLMIDPEAAIIQLARRGAAMLGFTPALGVMTGACDANVFASKGIECVNIGTGMIDIHTRNERLHIPSFFRSAEVALAVAIANAQ